LRAACRTSSGRLFAFQGPPSRPRRRARPRHRLGGLSSRTRTSTRTSRFMVPMRGCKAEGAPHEPDRHLLSPSLSSARSGGEGARRAGEEALRFMVPMHAKKRKGALHEPWMCRADIPVCRFTGLSSPVDQRLATRKSPEPAGWKACATSHAQFRGALRAQSSEYSLPEGQGELKKCALRGVGAPLPTPATRACARCPSDNRR
jgi:hypothetical protein